jgi:hypothetical protein
MKITFNLRRAGWQISAESPDRTAAEDLRFGLLRVSGRWRLAASNFEEVEPG